MARTEVSDGQVSTSEMNICYDCDRTFPLITKFCTTCGQELNQLSTTSDTGITCIECEGDQLVLVPKLFSSFSNAYLKAFIDHKETLEQKAQTIIRNINEIKIAKESNLINIGTYEVKVSEARKEIAEISAKLHTASMLYSELGGV